MPRGYIFESNDVYESKVYVLKVHKPFNYCSLKGWYVLTFTFAEALALDFRTLCVISFSAYFHVVSINPEDPNIGT